MISVPLCNRLFILMCTVAIADAATASLSADSEAAVVCVLDSTAAGDGASQWYVCRLE